jgi:hypothetical protein
MRIALIAPSYESHDFGLGRRVRELAHGVARAGGRMEVLANVSDARRVAAADEGVTVRVVRPPSGSGYPLSRALRAYLREHRASYDLVHAHGYLALPVAAASNGLLGRLVFSPEEREGSRGRIGQLAESSYRQVSRTALAATDLVICSSQIQADSIARQAPALSPRLRVVCDGVDVHSITRARPFLTQRRVILSFGRPGGGGRADRAIAALPDLGDG